MSTEKWNNIEAIIAADEAQREQDNLNFLNDQLNPCCRQAARVAYLVGRADRAIETANGEQKTQTLGEVAKSRMAT